MQHFTYNEFLPMVLGKEVMHNNDLVLLKDGYWNKYDQFLNPSTSNGFTIAFRWPITISFKIYAQYTFFRFGHTLLPSTIERWTKDHR